MRCGMKSVLLFCTVCIFPVLNVYAPPSANEWSAAPYCPGGCTLDYLKQGWSEYYGYKGSDWMESKKQEMLSSIANGTLTDWLDKDPGQAHNNVFSYYFYKGEIPNLEGKFISQVEQEALFSDVGQDLKNNQFPLGNRTYVNFTFLLTVAAITVGVVGFVIWRKGK